MILRVFLVLSAEFIPASEYRRDSILDFNIGGAKLVPASKPHRRNSISSQKDCFWNQFIRHAEGFAERWFLDQARGRNTLTLSQKEHVGAAECFLPGLSIYIDTRFRKCQE